jgi:SAM-dependent methyltransferase
VDLNQYIRELEAAGTSPADLRYMRESTCRFRAILATIPNGPAPLRILDIGPTSFTVFLRRRFPQHEFWCVDLSDAARARYTAEQIEHRVCDLNRDRLPLADEFFDLVIFTEVLEHLGIPPSRVLADIRRVLKPGGRLVLSVPNFAVLHKRIKLLLGRQVLPDPDRAFSGDGTGHLHEYTRAEIKSLARRAGFRIERVACLTWTPLDTWACRHRPLHDRLVRSAYHLVQWTWPTFRTILFLIATKP